MQANPQTKFNSLFIQINNWQVQNSSEQKQLAYRKQILEKVGNPQQSINNGTSPSFHLNNDTAISHVCKQ